MTFLDYLPAFPYFCNQIHTKQEKAAAFLSYNI